jgi:hypothetical protein
MRGPGWALLFAPLALIALGFIVRESCNSPVPTIGLRSPAPASTAQPMTPPAPDAALAQSGEAPRVGQTGTTSASVTVTEADAGAGELEDAAPSDAAAADAVPDVALPIVPEQPDAGLDAEVVEDATPAIAAAPEAPTPPAVVLGWAHSTTSGAWSFGDSNAPSTLVWAPSITSGAYQFPTSPPSEPVQDAGVVVAPPYYVDYTAIGLTYLFSLSTLGLTFPDGGMISMPMAMPTDAGVIPQ